MWNARDKWSRPLTELKTPLGLGTACLWKHQSLSDVIFSNFAWWPRVRNETSDSLLFCNHSSMRNIQLTLYIGREPKTIPASLFLAMEPSKAYLWICGIEERMFNEKVTFSKWQNSWVQILALPLLSRVYDLGKFWPYWLFIKIKWDYVYSKVLLQCKIYFHCIITDGMSKEISRSECINMTMENEKDWAKQDCW